jgi:hypothetical protein
MEFQARYWRAEAENGFSQLRGKYLNFMESMERMWKITIGEPSNHQ